MSKRGGIAQAVGVILAIGFLAFVPYLIWVVAARLLTFLESANPSVSAAAVGAMATVLVGVTGFLYTQARTKSREIEEAHRSRKVEIYKGFLVVARIMAKENPNVSLKPPKEQDLINFLVAFKTDVILWGRLK